MTLTSCADGSNAFLGILMSLPLVSWGTLGLHRGCIQMPSVDEGAAMEDGGTILWSIGWRCLDLRWYREDTKHKASPRVG